jgi:ATP-binding cassette, subfamily C, bacterial EexD
MPRPAAPGGQRPAASGNARQAPLGQKEPSGSRYGASDWDEDFAPRDQRAPGNARQAPPNRQAPPAADDSAWEWAWQADSAQRQEPARRPQPQNQQHSRAQGAPRHPQQNPQQQSALRRLPDAVPRQRENAPTRAQDTSISRSRALAIRDSEMDTPRRSSRAIAPRAADDHISPAQDIFDEALASVKKAVVVAGIFSLFTNVLTLGGPLYMLQIYDRVLTSGSVPTLVVLTVFLVVLYVALGLLEMLRGQILNRIAGRLDTQLGPATLEALPRHRLATGKGVADEPLRDLGTLRQFISGSGPAAFFDLPWAPLFLLIITIMHWSLGVVTLVGMIVMVGIAVANELGTKTLLIEAKKATDRATKLALESGRNLEASVSMGMMDPIVMRWQVAQQRADAANRKAGDRAAAFSSAAKIFRMFMQSVLLAAGALLVIDQQISSGMMIAVSTIGGKALGPLGTAVSQWRGLLAARDAFARLKTFHKRYPAEPKRLSLPAPKGRIEARNLQATPPGGEMPALRDVSFTLEAGEALGVIGASAAGKSTLARVLIGLWPPERGSVRLDGADLRMWNRDELGPHVGYLPQTIELFDGTIAQNISRFYPEATPEMIFRAAERVGVHEMIVDLPDGYNFRVGENGSRLSAGQRQRIGLARAIFGNPVLVVLDEPNANLDALGEAALHRALQSLKAARTTVILVTHRPSALDSVDHILVLEKGEVRAFGAKSKVLQALTRKGGQAGKGAVAAIPQQSPTKAAPQAAAQPRKEAQ